MIYKYNIQRVGRGINSLCVKMNTGSRFGIVRPCFLKKETENGQCEAQQSSKKI